ncbi:uncharacterized protein DNG_00971 [Cephalotrichum gorgonifer]|uniref:Uncharacterized protein n=1 Tax=Cephalotrichum gorgonifer TaxID=2041049 RepID=A0AAE8MPN9_9PEZI|nr:uncharacterized protein DNG_00971 [Cephalotrichum gorgonifer]
MSSFVARSVFRAATRRQASTTSTIRSTVRSIEPHPYERVAHDSQPASPAYGKMAKNAATRIVFFAPGIGLIFGWPLISKEVLNGHIS